MTINVAQILRTAALATPTRVAMTVVDPAGGQVDWTYAQLDRAARQVAATLTPGTRVAIQAPNGQPFVAAWFGALYAGCTIVPIPMGLPPVAVKARLAHADRLLTEDLGLTEAAPVLPAPWPLHRDGDDPAMILFTSGTTAHPRGVVIGHSALLLHTTTLVHRTLQLGPDDVILGVLPFTHSFGCRMVMLAGLVSGARIVATPSFSARGALALAADHGVTWIPAVPTMFAAWGALADDASVKRPMTVRWCLSAGAPLSDGVRSRAEAALGAEVRQGYGMTEATFSTIDAPPTQATPGSVGRPVWGVEVRVVDPSGADVPTGERGEILLRGPNQMLGYLDDPAATAARVDAAGWIHSGDVGTLDANGALSVIDRLKDVILRGGYTVYPSRVEAAIASFPGVAQVAVVGRPDDFYGEEIVACIVADAGAVVDIEALDRHLRTQLADAERPRQVRILDALPLGPSRKVLKRTLRDMVRAAC